MPQTMAADGSDRRDTETGRFTETVSDEAILEYLENHDLVGTTDVAEQFGRTRRTAHRRLRSLEDDGKVRSRTVGGSLIWQLADSENEV